MLGVIWAAVAGALSIKDVYRDNKFNNTSKQNIDNNGFWVDHKGRQRDSMNHDKPIILDRSKEQTVVKDYNGKELRCLPMSEEYIEEQRINDSLHEKYSHLLTTKKYFGADKDVVFEGYRGYRQIDKETGHPTVLRSVRPTWDMKSKGLVPKQYNGVDAKFLFIFDIKTKKFIRPIDEIWIQYKLLEENDMCDEQVVNGFINYGNKKECLNLIKQCNDELVSGSIEISKFNHNMFVWMPSRLDIPNYKNLDSSISRIRKFISDNKAKEEEEYIANNPDLKWMTDYINDNMM